MMPAPNALEDIRNELQQSADQLGLRLSIEKDFEELRRIHEAAMPHEKFNPTYDPAQRQIDPKSWWLSARTAQGRVVATHAVAMLNGDLDELIASCRLWLDRPPDDWYQVESSLRPLPEPVTGRLSHGGAIWIADDWRSRHLSSLLLMHNKALCLADAELTHVTGVVFEKIARRTLPTAAYGYPTVHLVISGYFPPMRKLTRMYALAMSREVAEFRLFNRFRTAQAASLQR